MAAAYNYCAKTGQRSEYCKIDVGHDGTDSDSKRRCSKHNVNDNGSQKTTELSQRCVTTLSLKLNGPILNGAAKLVQLLIDAGCCWGVQQHRRGEGCGQVPQLAI